MTAGGGRPIEDDDYRALAAYRHALRRFLAFSEAAARDAGLTPQQHQAILAIRGRGAAGRMTIGELADSLLIRPHSAVELVDRLVRAGLVLRSDAGDDRRRVVLALTPRAETILEGLSASHLDELRRGRALLTQLLDRLDTP